jgi:hypothetical protein
VEITASVKLGADRSLRLVTAQRETELPQTQGVATNSQHQPPILQRENPSPHTNASVPEPLAKVQPKVQVENERTRSAKPPSTGILFRFRRAVRRLAGVSLGLLLLAGSLDALRHNGWALPGSWEDAARLLPRVAEDFTAAARAVWAPLADRLWPTQAGAESSEPRAPLLLRDEESTAATTTGSTPLQVPVDLQAGRVTPRSLPPEERPGDPLPSTRRRSARSSRPGAGTARQE